MEMQKLGEPVVWAKTVAVVVPSPASSRLHPACCSRSPVFCISTTTAVCKVYAIRMARRRSRNWSSEGVSLCSPIVVLLQSASRSPNWILDICIF